MNRRISDLLQRMEKLVPLLKEGPLKDRVINLLTIAEQANTDDFEVEFDPETEKHIAIIEQFYNKKVAN